jgi:hypothetical protein
MLPSTYTFITLSSLLVSVVCGVHGIFDVESMRNLKFIGCWRAQGHLHSCMSAYLFDDQVAEQRGLMITGSEGMT